MVKLRHVVALVALTACVHRDTTVDPRFIEPATVEGPPGGEMDPGGSLASPPALTALTDLEIESTLEGSGQWIWLDDYGWVWRPYATEVGVDFTPYETSGSWVWTNESGWVYGNDLKWGWLPFHYGQWGWFEDYWAWVPGYEWTPAAVEWRGGGGYVGWRPTAPKVRDHRRRSFTPSTAQGGVVVGVRDHRRARLFDSQWRFAALADFGKRNIRAHLFKQAAEGLRVTSLTTRPPIRGTVQPVSVTSVMRGRLDRARAYAAPTSSSLYVPPPPRRAPRPTATVDLAPTPVEVPPSIYEPGDPFRGGPRTQSPIASEPIRAPLPSDATSWQPPARPTPSTSVPSATQWQPTRPLPSDATSWQPSPQPMPSPSTSTVPNWQPAQPVPPPLPRDAASWQPPPQPVRTPSPATVPNWQPAQSAPSSSRWGSSNASSNDSSSGSSRWGTSNASSNSSSSNSGGSRWGSAGAASAPSSRSSVPTPASSRARDHRN